jgi:hypothetical protein
VHTNSIETQITQLITSDERFVAYQRSALHRLTVLVFETNGRQIGISGVPPAVGLAPEGLPTQMQCSHLLHCLHDNGGG